MLYSFIEGKYVPVHAMKACVEWVYVSTHFWRANV